MFYNITMNDLYICNISCLKDETLFNKLYSSLPIERKNRIDKYHFENDKYLSIGSFCLLNKALQDRNISNYELVYGENNKPYLRNNELYFNISHSNEYVICLVSNEEVGCDIEKIKDVKLNVAKSHFHPNEYETIINSNNPLDTFFKFWTLKESFMKNKGLGLKLPLDSFEMVLEKDIKVKQNLDKQNYYFKMIDVDENYKCALCLLNNDDVNIHGIDLND